MAPNLRTCPAVSGQSPHTSPNLDIFSVVVVFATSLGANADAAAMLSAYGLIIVAACGGAGWAASGLALKTKSATVMHMLLMVGLALIGTVPLAELLARVSGIEMRWLLAPLAVLIAARPDWVILAIARWLSRRGVDPAPPTNRGPGA